MATIKSVTGSFALLLLINSPLASAQLPAPGAPITVPGVPGLPAVPLPLPALPIEPFSIPNPGLPLLPDPIAIVDPGALPSEIQIPDPLLILDPGNLPDPLLPGLSALPGLPAGPNERAMLNTSTDAGGLLGLPVPSAFELRQLIEQQLKQPLRDGVAQATAGLPEGIEVPAPVSPLAEVLAGLREGDAPIRVNTQALERALGELDPIQLRRAVVTELVDALLVVDPTAGLAALEQVDAQAYLMRLLAGLSPEQLAASSQAVVDFLEGDPLGGQMPAQLIALLLVANPVPVDTLGVDPLVAVQIVGNLMLAVASLPEAPVPGLALDANSIRNDLFDAINPLLAFVLAVEPGDPAALAQALEQALVALQQAAAAGVPSLLVPGVEIDTPGV